MIMPEKYKKYNLIPNTLKQGIDIILHDDEFLEKLEKKVNKKMVPYKYKHLSNYIEFIKKTRELYPEYSDDFDKYIQNLIDVNDINNWSVVKYILPTQKTHIFDDGTKIEPSFIQNKYYFMICAKHVEESYTVYTIDEQERVGIDYVWPITYFEVIEDPSGEIEKHFNDEYAVSERKKIYDQIRKMEEKKLKDKEDKK